MGGTAIQAATVLPKEAHSTQISGNSSVSSVKGSPFAGTLQKVVSEKSGADNGIDAAKLLKKLLEVLKQVPDNGMTTKFSSEKAEKIAQQLKEAFDTLRELSPVVQTDGQSLAVFFQLAQQMQLLLAAPKGPEEGWKAQQVNLSQLKEKLVTAITHLLEKIQISEQKAQISLQTQPGQIRSNQHKPVFSGQNDDKTGQPLLQGHAKRGSPGGVQQQSQIHSGSVTERFSPFSTNPKEMAVSAFRRSTLPADQTAFPGQAGGFDSGPVHRLQQFVLHVRQNGTTAGQQQFIREFQQILAQSKLTMIRGKQQLTLQLHPQHLGKLNIQLIHENGQLTARLVASTTAAKSLVEAHLPQLHGAFANQNLNVGKLQVLLPYTQQAAQHGYEQGGHQNEAHDSQQEADHHTDEDGESSDTDFLEWLEHLQLSGMPGVKK